MALSGLITIPWLTAILSALATAAKWIWDLVVATTKQAAAWAALVIPWIVRQASRNIANRLLIVGVWFGLMTAAWRLLAQLVGLLVSASVPWAAMAVESNIIVDLFWNDPVNAREFFITVLPVALSAQTTAASMRIVFNRLSWAFMVKSTSSAT